MGRGGPQGLLGGPHVGVDLRAVLLCVRGNVQIGHAVEVPVDPLGLGLQGCRHGGVVAPSGGQQDPGRHAETGIDLAHQFQAGFLPGQGVHAAHNVRRRHAVRFQAGAGHFQGFRLLGGLGQDGDRHRAVLRVGGHVVAAGHQGGVRVLDHDGVQEDKLLCVGHGTVRHGALLLRVLRGMAALAGVQHIHQDNGRHVEHAETGVHALAKGEVLEVVRIAHGLLALREGIAHHGLVDGRRRIRRHVDRGGAEDDLQARRPLDRCGQAGFLLLVVNAVIIRHS